jgi:hypothetical protein
MSKDYEPQVCKSLAEQDIPIPEHVDHRVCLHDFVSLDDGAVGCTICYWIWEVEEPLE